jgi:hypothetical protein
MKHSAVANGAIQNASDMSWRVAHDAGGVVSRGFTAASKITG